MRRLVALLFVTLALSAGLAGCGKKGKLEPPPDARDVEYPRQYPR